MNSKYLEVGKKYHVETLENIDLGVYSIVHRYDQPTFKDLKHVLKPYVIAEQSDNVVLLDVENFRFKEYLTEQQLLVEELEKTANMVFHIKEKEFLLKLVMRGIRFTKG